MPKDDELNTQYDEMDLDMDIMGDEGDLVDDTAGSRKPATVTREFFSGMLNGVGTGMKKVAADEFARKFPIANEVKQEAADTFSEFKQLSSDLSRELQPMLVSLEMSTQKLLPKAKKLIPSRLYDKITKKLDERAKERREAAMYAKGPSKEELEQESIDQELSVLFGEQAEQQAAMQAENRQTNLLNQALEANRTHKLDVGLSHIFEAARGTELFHRTTHTAYMKKSLELKYKHLFATRDIFNLMKQQSFMMEEYLRGIAKNTSIPDFMKEKPMDYVYKERTQSFGNTIGEYVGNFRKNLIKKVKERATDFIQNGVGGIVSGLNQAADAADMAAGIPGGEDMMKGMAANSVGSMIMSSIINHTIGGAGVRALTDKITPFTQDLDKTIGNFKTKGIMKLDAWRKRMAQGGGGFLGSIAAGIADMIPGMEPMVMGSNDLLTDADKAATFDKMTRASIVEIIPGFLGKILQSVEAVRTGTVGEETVYDVRSRMFVSESRMRETAAEAMFGEESVRQDLLGKSLGALRAGYATGHNRKETEAAFKGLDKDIYRVLLNHAIYNRLIDPEAMKRYVITGRSDPYIEAITTKVERPSDVLKVFVDSLYNEDGAIDKGTFTEIDNAFVQIMQSDAYKKELPTMFESWGMRRFFSDKFTKVERERLTKAAEAGNAEAKAALERGTGLIQAGTNKFNLDRVTEQASDIDYTDVASIARTAQKDTGDRLKNSSRLRQTATDNFGKVVGNAANKAGDLLSKAQEFLANRGLVTPEWLESLIPTLSNASASTITDKVRSKMSEKGFSVGRESDWNDANEGISKRLVDGVEALEQKLRNRAKYLKSKERAKTPEGKEFKRLAKKYGEHYALMEDEEYAMISEKLQEVRSKYDEAVDKRDKAYEAADNRSYRENIKSKLDEYSKIATAGIGDAAKGLGGAVGGVTTASKDLVESFQASVGEKSDIFELLSSFKASTEQGFNNLVNAYRGVDVQPIESTPVDEETAEPEVTAPSIVDVFNDWRQEYTSVTGTIFDAIMHVAEVAGQSGGGEGGEGASGPKVKKPSFLGRAAKGLGGAAKFVGDAYVKTYSAIINNGMKAAGYVGKGLLNVFGASPYLDIYVKGEIGPKPLVTWKQQAYDPGIVFADNGERVKSSKEIDRPCIDPRTGNVVITQEDIAKGLVTISNNPIGSAVKMAALGIGGAAKVIGKGYFQVYAAALKGLGKVGSAIAGGLFGSKEEQFFDVYLKDQVDPDKPLLTAKQQEEGVFFKGKERVIRTKDIDRPVFVPGKTKPRMVISEKHIEHGLVDINNKPISKGHSASDGVIGKIGSAIKSLAGGVGKTLPKVGDLYSHVYKGLFDLGKKGVEGAGKLIGKVFGIGKGGGGSLDEEGAKFITDRMDKMITALEKIVENTTKPKKKAGDADGDGDVDGSYADQMQKKAKEGRDREDLDDLHVDVDHSASEDGGEEGEGGEGQEGDSVVDKWKKKGLDKFKKSKFARNMKARWLKGKRKLGRWGKTAWQKTSTLAKKGLGKAGSFAKSALGKVGQFAKPLAGKLGGFAGKAGGLLAKGGGLLAKGGGALLKGGGMLASKIGLGSLLGGAGSAAAGAGTAAAGTAAAGAGAAAGGTALAGLASAALPAAAAAAALYGGYRMAKGFTAKETMDNLGIEDERDVLFEDRMASALGFNTKIGAKAVRGLQKISPIVGLIKGIRGNANPMTPEEVEQGRAKLQNKIDKGLPGYDRILSEYDKAVEDHNWTRARQLCGKEADGIIKSVFKHSVIGRTTIWLGKALFGDKDKPMEEGEIEKVRAKFESLAGKGNKQAEKLLDKFNDYVEEGEWKKARELAGMEERGLFGKMFQDSKGNIQWGSAIGAAFGPMGWLIGSLFNKADKNKPMDDKEIEESRQYLQKLIDGGNKAAEKVLDQFEEAVTEMNWKKARALVGKDVKSNLEKLGSGLKTTGKWALRLSTLGLSTLFESDQEKPMTEEEIKKFTDKMNYLIEKGDKVAEKKLDAFERAIAKQDWEKARHISKMEHKSLITRAAKATWSFFFGDDNKEMSEQEMTKFRESMQRKIQMGNKAAEKKLDAFEDVVGRQNWKKARAIADMPDDGVMQKIGKGVAAGYNWVKNFIFGGDSMSMSEGEIEKARKKLEAEASEGPKGQKKLDAFNDAVADEKWERARQIAEMPYENAIKRAGKAIGGWLFGNDETPMTPEEISKFQGECEAKIEDGDKKAEQVLDKFNSYVEKEQWVKARELSGFKDWGVVGAVKKGVTKVWNWLTGNSDAEDCDELREKIEEKALDDETGMIQAGLEQFEGLYRRRKYNDAMTLGEDLLKLSPKELKAKHGFSTEEFDALAEEANKLVEQINIRQKENNGWLHPIIEMKLAMLRRKITSSPDEWSTDFLDDARSEMAQITGEDEFAEDFEKDDGGTAEKARLLIEDTEKALDNCSAWKHPIDKVQLAGWNILNKAQAPNMTDEELEARYSKMQEDFGDYFSRSAGSSEEESSSEEEEGEEEEEEESYDEATSEGGSDYDEELDGPSAAGDLGSGVDPEAPADVSIEDYADEELGGAEGSTGSTWQSRVKAHFAGTNRSSISTAVPEAGANEYAGVGAVDQQAVAATPAPVSSSDVATAATNRTTSAVSSAFGGDSLFSRIFGGGKKQQTGDMGTVLQQLVQQNQQLIQILSAVMTANGVKVEGMELLAQGLAGAGGSTTIINNTSSGSGDKGLDLRKIS